MSQSIKRAAFKALIQTGRKLEPPGCRVQTHDAGGVLRIEDGDSPDTVGGIRGVYDQDAAFISGVMARTKWAPPEPKPEPAPGPVEPERPRTPDAEVKLRAEIRRLKGEIEALGEKKKKRRKRWWQRNPD